MKPITTAKVKGTTEKDIDVWFIIKFDKEGNMQFYTKEGNWDTNSNKIQLFKNKQNAKDVLETLLSDENKLIFLSGGKIS